VQSKSLLQQGLTLVELDLALAKLEPAGCLATGNWRRTRAAVSRPATGSHKSDGELGYVASAPSSHGAGQRTTGVEPR
jgi:hypothetical protein